MLPRCLGGAVAYKCVVMSRRIDLWGLRVDEIPPERAFIVTVLLGRELVIEEHTVSRIKAVTRQGESSGNVV